ncbi:MAG: N-acetyltransferase [Chitinophagaceae bacterium]|nr:N-acetyltransferase [Chitinophagaceae bacterium]
MQNKFKELENKFLIKKSALRKVKTGKGVTIIQPSNLYECRLGNNCFVGPFTEIQKGVVIGDNCRIQSHSFICELVTIGNNCFIGHGVMFINDTFSDGKPSAGNQSKWKKTIIGNNVSVGSNATILPVNICDNVVIGAGAVVTKNINRKGVYAGNPAKRLPQKSK